MAKKKKGWIPLIVGERFNLLISIRESHRNKHGRRMCWFLCDCGVLCCKDFHQVRYGNTRSCGCLSRSMARERMTKHGDSGHPLYGVWRSMVSRCENSGHPQFHVYGGRGISVCAKWRDSFAEFAEYMGDRPEGTSVDRIDNDRGYEPGNVRWATPREQARNRRDCVDVSHRGDIVTITELSERIGVHRSTVDYWIKKGLTGDQVEERFSDVTN